MSRKKLVKDIGLVGSTNLIVALKGLVILPIISKTLGAEAFGTWAQIVVAIQLAGLVLTLGLPYALVRFLAAEEKKEEIQESIYSVFSIVFLIGLLVLISLVLFSNQVSSFLGNNQNLVLLLAFITLFECLNLVFLNVFRAFQEMEKYSIFVILRVLSEVGLVATFVILGHGLTGAVLSLLIARLIVFLVMGFLVVRKISPKMPNFSKLKEYLAFGLPTVPGNISSWIVRSSNRYLIGFFLGTLFVGYYAPAVTVSNIISLFVTPLAFVLPAVLSKLYDTNKTSEVRHYLKYSLKYFLMVTIPTAFGLSVLSKQLLTLLSTPEIAAQGYLIVPFIATSTLLLGSYVIVSQILVLAKKTAITGKIWIAAATLNLVLNLLLIPKVGIIGAAVASLLAYIFAFTTTWYYSAKNLQFEIDWKFILKSIFASTLMVLLVRWLNPTGLINILITTTAGALLYGLLILLLHGFNKRETAFFLSFLKIKNFIN